MNAPPFSATAAHAASSCFHCGQPVPRGLHYRVVIDGCEHTMCCAGCAAVAQTIVDHGLTSYYIHRSALPAAEQIVPRALSELAAYSAPEVENALTREDGPDARIAALMLEGITCAACIWLIEKRLMRLPGVLGVDLNYATHRALVRWDPRRAKLADIIGAVAALGYRASPYDRARAENARSAERSSALWRLFVAGFGMMQVMMYLVPEYVTHGEMTPDIEQLMHIASLILTLPVMLYSAAPFYRGAWRDVRTRHLGMDVPVALGIVVAFAASAANTLHGSGPVYFDSVTMFVFLLLAARYLELMARARCALTQEQLAEPGPAVAERLASWPASELSELVASASLRAGDHLRVRPGATVPADGVIVDGASEIDERLLTGESRPLPKSVGDEVTGGSISVDHAFVMRVTRVGDQTTRAAIQHLLEHAATVKPRLELSADRYARYFVQGLLVLAALTFAAWYAIDATRALWIAVAVLVVSCPCALSLATPAALAAATSALHGQGVLIANGDALENLARATDFVFDKTGTLTTGTLRLARVIPLACSGRTSTPDECLAWAAALEASSEHPIARAITMAAQALQRSNASGIDNVAGSGIEGVIDGVRLRFGTPQFVAALHAAPLPAQIAEAEDDMTVVALGNAEGWLALFLLSDTLRPEARAVVARLMQEGKRVHLVSGDRAEIVRHVAHAIGIVELRAAATPADKLHYIRELQECGRVVAMIGDGINDAAGLAAAHVSIAMAGGADIARSHSDVILHSGRLASLTAALDIARATLRVIRQNLAWALLYNAAAIPLAVCGYVTPLIAGVGMAASSMLVVANAARLMRSARPLRTI